MVVIKRIYDQASPSDGYRVLIDRLWPRGIKKDKADLDEWLARIAPSRELRTWFNHDPTRWEEFADMYRNELSAPEAEVELQRLLEISRNGRLTLLFAAKSVEHNNAVVLRARLLELGPYQDSV